MNLSTSQVLPQAMLPYSFGSDNHSGVHPDILAAIAVANSGSCSGYGDDHWTAMASVALRTAFSAPDAGVYLVPTGTGANILAVAGFLRPFQSVLCSRHSHLYNDETGGPERQLGCKLVPVDTVDGKLAPEVLSPLLYRRGDFHTAQPRVVSITNSSESGLVYSVAEVKALASFCHAHGLVLHVDGARLANAAAALDVPLAQLTTQAGVDVVSFGGTKNGALAAEAVIILQGHEHGDLLYHRKQLGLLISKHRFIAAQILGLLKNDLWLANARHANAMAQLLAGKLTLIPGITITRPVVSNMIFARFPKDKIPKLQRLSPFYETDPILGECRLVTSFATAAEQIEKFCMAAQEVLGSE